jgi:antirestriction protein ArdC
MPNVEAFENKAAYYGTLFHELAHSTGHQIRCNRKSLTENVGRSNLDVYTVEELVAELASSYLDSFAGIQYDLPNSVSYMQDWITTLKKKDSKTMIISAAAQAQKACDYILNIQPVAET